LAADVSQQNEIDPAADNVVSFKLGAAGTLSTDHRLSKAALMYLGQSWPGMLRFPALVEAAFGVLGEAADRIRLRFEDELETLKQILFRAALAGYVSLHLFPPKLTTDITDRPKASRLARKQAESGRLITSLQHTCIILEDDILRRFLALVDGTRTIEDLVADLTTDMKHGDQSTVGAASGEPEVTNAAVIRNLRRLARLGLLET
jgi:hypothetical protein